MAEIRRPSPIWKGSSATSAARSISIPNASHARNAAQTDKFKPVPLSDKGKVYVFSVVHQSFPGIKTPYVTAIVDLPEGVSVRANLTDVDPEQAQKEPNKVFNLPVEIGDLQWRPRIAKVTT